MNTQTEKVLRLAILDLYDKTENLGMRAIESIVSSFPEFEYEIFDVRANCEVPGLDFDVYVFSGGPGTPLEGDGLWERAFSNLLDRLWTHNGIFEDKKHVFFICHSFQMVCNHFGLGDIVPRRSKAFGVFPVHKTLAGMDEPLFEGLSDPFYAADFRDWQFIQPNEARLKAMGAKILAIEKERPHVPLERAVMAVRFSPYWFGVQFHPEAEAQGMIAYLSEPEIRANILEHHGEEKFTEIKENASDPDRLEHTRESILPRFLENAVKSKLKNIAAH